MEPFIRNDQFNFIKDQALVLANSHASVNDKAVLSA
ncbi:elongation factor G-binding protein, partial [Heyndrickxia sporothermodurans]